MKPFQFTLEAVRITRQRHEHDAMEHYAQALLARGQALARLDAVQQQINATFQEMRNLLAKGCSALKASQAQDYQRSLEIRRNDCARALELAERRVNSAMNAMLVARRDRELVDKCYEKQKARHLREQSRAEQKLLDDLAGRRPASIFAWSPTGAAT